MSFRVGEKILRKILNPVISVSLESPSYDQTPDEDSNAFLKRIQERTKEKVWEKVPDRLRLAAACYMHAFVGALPNKELAQSFTLSDE